MGRVDGSDGVNYMAAREVMSKGDLRLPSLSAPEQDTFVVEIWTSRTMYCSVNTGRESDQMERQGCKTCRS